jgi:uncharacterized protein
MTGRPFQARLEDLPRILPVFPLPGALLLPEGKLPLNIFEPRYLALVQEALAWGRMFGVIQPAESDGAGRAEPALYETGCVGRISAFSETEDGRMLLTLTGVCRFRVIEEVESNRGYRRVAADWERYRDDIEEQPEPDIDRRRLMTALKRFSKLHDMELSWKAVEAASNLSLTIWLPMACPFEPPEKQALLECATAGERAEILSALMEMAVAESKRGVRQVRQ